MQVEISFCSQPMDTGFANLILNDGAFSEAHQTCAWS